MLRRAGWPATFILMYDEAWQLADLANQKMRSLTSNINNGDMLAWDIDPNRDEAGFSPHRDRQPDDIPSSFHSTSGMPKYSTAWIALTDATPENSCLYVVPKMFDPGYHNGDLDDMDPLQRCLPNKTCYQNIRALPIVAGDGIFFSHRILHWGSRGRVGYTTPRMALSIACSADSFEPCYFLHRDQQLPSPEYLVRLGLVCGQCICYHERFDFNGSEIKLFTSLWRNLSENFSEFYVKKVLKEMLPAIEEAMKRDEERKQERKQERKPMVGNKMVMKSAAVVAVVAAAAATRVGAGDDEEDEENDEDDDEDDMLDEALDAMLEGGDSMDYHDDFDDCGEGVMVAAMDGEQEEEEEEEEEEEGDDGSSSSSIKEAPSGQPVPKRQKR